MYKPPFWINLPSEITTNILSRLPIRTIVSCKCVCKQWLHLLSTPEFAKSHISVSTPGLAVKEDTICKIFEFEDVLELQHHNLHYNPVMQFNLRTSINSTTDNIWICRSVNGLLFLDHSGGELDNFYICNPITSEYISLPKPEGIIDKYPNLSQYGFGVSAITGQYKVVRNSHKCTHDPNEQPCSRIQNYECLVYTVGTGSWRSIPPGSPFGHYHNFYSVFLNGNLHGLTQDYCGSADMLISCFDLETELFKPFSPPPPTMDTPSLGSLGVLDDCLCFCDNTSRYESVAVIWVMKEYGVKESWTKQFVIAAARNFIGDYVNCVYTIKAFKDGDILLYREHDHLFYYSSKTENCQKLDFFIQDPYFHNDAVLYNPSFISLKSFDGENVKSFS